MGLEKLKNRFKKTSEQDTVKGEKKKFFKGKKKIIIPVLIIAILGASIFAWSKSKGEQNPMVTTMPLTKGTIEHSLSITGKIEGTDSAEISSSLNYEIVQINVKEGDYVEKGQVLAVLDDKDLKQEINLSQKDLELAELQYKENIDSKSKLDTSTASATISVNQSQIEYDEAKRQLEIKKALFESGAIPKEEYTQAEISVQKSEIALELAKDGLRKAKLDVQKTIDEQSPKASDKKALEIKREQLNQKQQDLEKVYIKSPISGTVTRVNARLGRTPQASDDNKPLFVVENLSDLRMKVSISEFDIGSIKAGLGAEISADVLGSDKVNALVYNISPTGEPKEGGNSKEMVIPVILDIVDEDPRLIAGVTASAKIMIEQKDNVFKVPYEAVLEEDGKNYLVIEKDKVLKRVPVELGLESDVELEVISSELKENDSVVLSPDPSYIDGMKVEKMPEMGAEIKTEN